VVTKVSLFTASGPSGPYHWKLLPAACVKMIAVLSGQMMPSTGQTPSSGFGFHCTVRDWLAELKHPSGDVACPE